MSEVKATPTRLPRWEPRNAAGPLRGWLLLLSRLLIVGQPLLLAASASDALSKLAVRGPELVIVLVMRVLVTAFGVAAGMALSNRRDGAVAMAKTSLLVSAAMDVFVYTTPYYPNNRMPGDTPLYVAASLGYYAIWFAYLSRSKRVRETFEAPPYSEASRSRF